MLILFFMVLLSFSVTVFIMHEKTIPDEYAKWAQGWTAGLLTSLTLAMNRSAEKPHQLAPGTTEATLRVQPPVPVIPASSALAGTISTVPVEATEDKPVDPFAFRRSADPETPKGQ